MSLQPAAVHDAALASHDGGVDWARVRADFPPLMREVHGKPLVYFDNANTSQKPQAVIEAVDRHYREHNANVSRAVHLLGEEATAAYEGARDALARFIHARSRDELVLTSGTTQAANLVAYSFALPRLKAGDAILTTTMEHHANIVPWQIVAARAGDMLDHVNELGRAYSAAVCNRCHASRYGSNQPSSYPPTSRCE